MNQTTKKLKFRRDHYEQLKDHLLQEDGNERFAYLYCVPSADNWIVNEHRLLEDDQMKVIEPMECRPDIDVEFDYLNECRRRGKIPVLLHSHPFADTAWFSSRDYRLMNNYREWITGLYDDWDLGFAVMSREELASRRISDDTEGFDPLQSVVVGKEYPPEPSWPGVDPEDNGNDVVDEERQSRAILAHGETTQKRVSRMHVVVAGVGGVGSSVAEQLARLGVGKLTLVDPDIVERSNLSRLIGAAPHHVDRPKVDAIRESVYRSNPDTEVETVEGKLEDHEEAVKHADIIIQCVDRDISRSSLAQLAAKHLVPVIDAGIKIIRGNDHEPGTRAVFLFNTIPGDSACFHCLGRGNPEQMRIESMNEREIEHVKRHLERGFDAVWILCRNESVRNGLRKRLGENGLLEDRVSLRLFRELREAMNQLE